MSLPALSLAALFVVIVVSCFSRLNVGVLSVAMAWIVGVYFGGMKAEAVAVGFPASLFLTLAGVTLLFSQAQENGTLDRLAHQAVRLCRGRAVWVPVTFFFLAAALASLGPGNIATAALIAPMAMAAAGRSAIPAFLMAIMVGNGANAGSLSPFAPTGIIAAQLMAKIGLPNLQWESYCTNLAAHAFVAFAGYAIFGGLRLFRAKPLPPEPHESSTFERKNWITLAAIGALVAGVVFLKVQVGMGAFAVAVFLELTRAGDVGAAIRKMPWNVILMVTGVTVLIALLEKTGGLELFAGMLAAVSTAQSVNGVMAFVTGVISTYSSTSGVVLPAFLPTIPALAERLSADPKAIALSINIGSHLVDVSPLSTIGALCIASASPLEDPRRLFHQLLAWGLSMTVVAAAICWAVF